MSEPQKNPSKGFIVLSDSAGNGEFQKKSLHKSDPGKGVNLHRPISKMAASETFNVLLRLYITRLFAPQAVREQKSKQ